MDKKRKMAAGIFVITLVGMSITNALTSKKRIKKLEAKLSDISQCHKTLLNYQNEKNMEIDQELETIREEFSSVYGHMEELLKEKEEVR